MAETTEDGEITGETWARVARRRPTRMAPVILSRSHEEVKAMFEHREPTFNERAELTLTDDTVVDNVYMQIPPKLRPLPRESQHHKKLRHALAAIGITFEHVREISFIGRSIAQLLVPSAHTEHVTAKLKATPGGSVLLENFDPLAEPKDLSDRFHRHVDT
ncbi:hypothetical protein HK101_000576, partial [Irineochytrium annulatum]